jgi:hypothetical protein
MTMRKWKLALLVLAIALFVAWEKEPEFQRR